MTRPSSSSTQTVSPWRGCGGSGSRFASQWFFAAAAGSRCGHGAVPLQSAQAITPHEKTSDAAVKTFHQTGTANRNAKERQKHKEGGYPLQSAEVKCDLCAIVSWPRRNHQGLRARTAPRLARDTQSKRERARWKAPLPSACGLRRSVPSDALEGQRPLSYTHARSIHTTHTARWCAPWTRAPRARSLAVAAAARSRRRAPHAPEERLCGQSRRRKHGASRCRRRRRAAACPRRRGRRYRRRCGTRCRGERSPGRECAPALSRFVEGSAGRREAANSLVGIVQGLGTRCGLCNECRFHAADRTTTRRHDDAPPRNPTRQDRACSHIERTLGADE